MERFEADLLIPGVGEPVRGGVVVVDGPAIAYAGPAAGAPRTPEATVVRALVVMPGMWDCHGHFMGLRSLDFARLPLETVGVRVARCVGDLRAALDAGVTSVREPGGLGLDLVPAIAEGLVAGPSIYAAGAILSTTGGHADTHSLPLGWVVDFAHVTGEFRLCDGVDECVRAVREQLRRNAKLIKICASGGVLSEVDHPVHQQFTQAELKAIVEVAGLAERSVAAHCHGKPGMMAALEAGVRTIEHGTFLDEEVCQAMKETGAVLVPTRTIIDETLTYPGLPAYALSKMQMIAETHLKAIAIARENGVRIASGTDIGMSGADLPAAWGRNGREPQLLVQAGLTPLEAIEAATANGPLTLGAQAPLSGVLREGYAADLLTLRADPVADIAVLADPANITGVWRAGVKVKG
jgi:imidazolonepropionase-like amidohydrolase